MDQINCWSFFIIILYFQCKAKYQLLLNVLLKATASRSSSSYSCQNTHLPSPGLLAWVVGCSQLGLVAFIHSMHDKKTSALQKDKNRREN